MPEIMLMKYEERKEELRELFQIAFGHSKSIAVMNWKYLQNPLVHDSPDIIVAVDNSTIVGAKPFLLTEVWINDEKVKTAQSCDTVVHPEYQRRGIFSQMNQFAIDHFRENGYLFLYNFPSHITLQLNLKQGWKVVSLRDNLFQILNPQKLASYTLKNQLAGKIFSFFYEEILNTSEKSTSFSNPFKIEVFDKFNNQLQSVDNLRNKKKIELVRSEPYLRWRFDQHPEHTYIYIIAKRYEELCGYAVISVQEKFNNLTYGMIVDYLVKGDDIACFRTLIDQGIKELGRLKCDLISIWAFSEPEIRADLLKHFGFNSSINFPYNIFLKNNYFIVKELDERLFEKIDIFKQENWRITYAYPDTT